jgi:peptide/nickel transport system substrate-binding protein
MRPRRILCAVSVLGLVATAGCGATHGGTTSTGPTGTAKQGGVLTIGAAQSIAELNPVTKANAWEQVLFSLMWDGLVKTGQDQKTIEPDLATSWTPSVDLKTWTFQLRSGVKFSNGDPLTAANVVSTIKYYQDPKTTTQLKNNVAPIADVQANGDTTVVFTLSTPNALFPSSIEMVKVVDMSALGTMETQPAVTGPFKVKEFVADDHLTLERNPGYFGTAPKLDGIKLVKAADASSAVTALQSGDLDALWSVPLSQVSAIEANPKLAAVKPSVIGQYVSWEVDTTAPPFNNPLARQALAYAIDAKSILKAAYFGQGVVSTVNDPLTTNNPDFGGTLTDYSYNLDKAKSLFAQAGITAGASFTWWGASNQYPEWNTSAQILQASLKQIGIDLKIQNTDIASWPAKFYPAGKSFPGLIVPNFQSYEPDAADEFLFLRTGRCECNWNNAQFDQLYNQALATADPAARKAVWGQLQALVNQQAPIFVPLQFATVTATKRNVVGLWVDGGGNPHLENAGFAS